jgi:hypothetical protein
LTRWWISVMPESPGLYLGLTVTKNLQCFAGLYELDNVRGASNAPWRRGITRSEYGREQPVYHRQPPSHSRGVLRGERRHPLLTVSRKDANVSNQNP